MSDFSAFELFNRLLAFNQWVLAEAVCEDGGSTLAQVFQGLKAGTHTLARAKTQAGYSLAGEVAARFPEIADRDKAELVRHQLFRLNQYFETAGQNRTTEQVTIAEVLAA